MGAPSASTRIESILRPLVREVMQWSTGDTPPDLLADDLVVLLCRELTRQQLAESTDTLTTLDALGLTARLDWEQRAANAEFPWAPVSSIFAERTEEFNFLLRASLLVQDLNGGEDTDPAEVPGLIFERVIALTTKYSGTRRQKKLGIHFTPAALAQALASRVLEKVLLYATGENARLTIIDPCLGGGALWLAALRWARDSLKLTEAQLKTWPLGTLFGVDICRVAGEVAILTLRIESKADVAFHLQMQEQFLCGDSLSRCDKPSWPTRWSAVLSNPPWNATKCQNNSIVPRSTPRQDSTSASSVEDFVSQALTLADEAGGFGLIVPSKMLDQVSYSSTRETLISRGLNAALDLGNGFFPTITENAALLIGTLNSTDTNIQLGFLDEACGPKHITFQSRSSIRDKSPFSLRESHQVTHLTTGFCKLSELVSVTDSGIDYSTAEMGRLILYESNLPHSGADIPALRGRDVHPFKIDDCTSWLRHDWKSQRDELRKTHPKVKAKANEAIYQQSPKILIRQTGAKLTAAIDWQSSGHQRSLLALASEHIETLQLVLVILNHDWTNTILQKLSNQQGRDFAQLKAGVLKELRIPRWKEAEAQELRQALGRSLSVRLEFDEPSQDLAGRWVESLYRRRGYHPKALGEAS